MMNTSDLYKEEISRLMKYSEQALREIAKSDYNYRPMKNEDKGHIAKMCAMIEVECFVK